MVVVVSSPELCEPDEREVAATPLSSLSPHRWRRPSLSISPAGGGALPLPEHGSSLPPPPASRSTSTTGGSGAPPPSSPPLSMDRVTTTPRWRVRSRWGRIGSRWWRIETRLGWIRSRWRRIEARRICPVHLRRWQGEERRIRWWIEQPRLQRRVGPSPLTAVAHGAEPAPRTMAQI